MSKYMSGKRPCRSPHKPLTEDEEEAGLHPETEHRPRPNLSKKKSAIWDLFISKDIGNEDVFWSYIVGMLTNLDSLPLERIHQMLKMFASQGECSLQELRHFLERKVRDHELLFSGGLYRLPKP